MGKTTQRKIIFLNTHSILNSGDTGIVLAQVQLFKRYFSDVSISITARTPELDQKFYGPFGIKVFPPLIPAPSVFPPHFMKIEQIVKNLFALKSKRELIHEIDQSDLVISSGGGYFYSNRKSVPGPMFFQNYFHVKLASMMSKPIIFFPQSFGPFFNRVTSTIFREVMESDHILKIFAREKASYQYLQNLVRREKSQEHLDVCPDMAFYLENRDQSSRNTYRNLPRPIMAMTLRQWDFPAVRSNKEKRKKQADYFDILKEICQKFYQIWGGSIVIVPQVRGPGMFENDRIISEEFYGTLEKVISQRNLLLINIPDTTSPFHIMQLLSQVDLLLATRLHSAIFALLSNIPTISIGYQPKSQGIMELLDLEHFCVDITDLHAQKILDRIEEIFHHYDVIQGKIRAQISCVKETIETKLANTIKSF
jgi:colanic acid/amylovoran biosynthesis protein